MARPPNNCGGGESFYGYNPTDVIDAGRGPSKPGTPGLSAYQIAVRNGFRGTEQQWLATMIGMPGKDGIDGTDGEDGEDGAPGVGLSTLIAPTDGDVPEWDVITQSYVPTKHMRSQDLDGGNF